MGDLYRVNTASIDLDKPLQRVDVGTLLASGDSNADRFQTIVTRGGKPVDLTGYEVKAYFIRPSKDTAEVDGVIDGGSTALVVLPAACYKYSGIFSLAVKVKSGENALTLCIYDGYIKQTQVGGVVDHDDTLPSLEHIMELLERMEDAADRTEEAAKDAQTTVATTAPAIEKTASGAVVTVADAAARLALSVVSEIRCLQLGGTDASPDNVKPISRVPVQLYHGAAHDMAAEPVATASLPDAVFGGSYDWATGAVTMRKCQYVPKGADITSYGTASTGVPYVQLTMPEAWSGSGAMCSHYRIVSGAPSSAAIRLVAPWGCYIYDPRFTDRATAAALLDAENVQIVYDLQEAKAIQVEPVGLMLFKGGNAIWSGVGDTAVRYVVDTQTYVDALGVKPERFELIETITLTEPSVILRTQEPDGTPYNFEAVIVKAKTVTPAANAMFGYYHTSKGQLLRVYQSNPNCTNGQIKQRVDIVERKGQYLCAMYLDWGYEYVKIDPNHYMTAEVLDTENIVKIDWRQTLEAGTTVTILGVRANA